MSDATPEQQAADAALEAALDQIAQAYGHTGVRVAYLVVTSNALYEDDTPCSSLQYHSPDGQPWVTTLGLHRAMGLHLERDYLGPP